MMTLTKVNGHFERLTTLLFREMLAKEVLRLAEHVPT